jgi:hypothetical protein
MPNMKHVQYVENDSHKMEHIKFSKTQTISHSLAWSQIKCFENWQLPVIGGNTKQQPIQWVWFGFFNIFVVFWIKDGNLPCLLTYIVT